MAEKRNAEIDERELRRLERWWKSLPAEKQRALKKETTGDTPTNLALLAKGFIERCPESPTGFLLTGAGELELHQLRLRDWMAKHPHGMRKERKERAAAKAKQLQDDEGKKEPEGLVPPKPERVLTPKRKK